MKNQTPNRAAFTLVELLVVIAIIALLLAVLLPAMGTVRTNAKVAQTRSIYTGLDTGIESFRAEQTLGASLPPSAPDAQGSPIPPRIASPFGNAASSEMIISGAQLLVMALVGADGLGTPGFKAIGSPSDGFWWNDTFNGGGDCNSGGLYCVRTTGTEAGKEKYPRYGPYADEKLRERVKSVKELGEKGRILNPDNAELSARTDLGFFTDAWDLPILYYKASPGNNVIVRSNDVRGIYRQEDNGLITGTRGNAEMRGLDFGSGALPDRQGDYHFIADNTAPTQSPAEVQPFLDDTNVTFARYIVDSKIRSRITPVHKDSYLLISAGPDGIYGNADDITNWTRDTD